MFEPIRRYFVEDNFEQISLSSLSDKEVLVASAVLLLETAFVDFCYPTSEQEAVRRMLILQFGVSEIEAEELLSLAGVARSRQWRLTPFVNLLSEQLSSNERKYLLAMIWKVIKADSIVQPSEREFALKLAERLRLSVEDEIEARQLVMQGKV